MSKNIIILNGSPRLKGNTAMLCDAFMKGAESAGHAVTRFDLQKLDIHGCLGCMKGGKTPASPMRADRRYGSDLPCIQKRRSGGAGFAHVLLERFGSVENRV